MGQVSVLVSVFGGETTKLEHGSWLVTYDDCDYYYIGLTLLLLELWSIPGTVLPPGYSLWLFSYKPFMWCRSDARLRHAFCCRPFEASLQTPDRCIFLFLFSGLHIHVLYEQPACVHHGFCLFRDWHCDHRIFQSMIIICYIIPVYIMFASTFKSTHWLVPGYCLGQITCLESSVAKTAPEPKQRW